MKRILLAVLTLLTCNAFEIPYLDQKQNCTNPLVNGSFCYSGPQYDLFGQLKTCVVPGTVALTFDDGPSIYTAGILDSLKKYGMRATFFVIGSQIPQFTQVIQRMVNEGHELGSHTYGHPPDLTNMTMTDIQQDLSLWERTLIAYNFSGPLSYSVIPNYFRAPHGLLDAVSASVITGYGYTPIHWGWLSGDSYNLSPSQLTDVYFSHMGNGSTLAPSQMRLIMQQHDAQVNTSLVFDSVANYLSQTVQSQGVRFVTIAECLGLGIPPYRAPPRFQNDPVCANGINALSGGAHICCDPACGICGGTGCSLRPGGAGKCCANNIVANNVSCWLSPAPCLVSSNPPPFIPTPYSVKS